MLLCLCSVMMIGLAPGLLQAEPGLAQRALERMAGIEMDRWAYERVQVRRDATRVDHHDPARAGAEHWQLVSIDGRAPTPEEKAEYARTKSRHDQGKNRFGSGREIVDMLVLESLSLLSSDHGGASYTFRVSSPDGRKKQQWERISGELHVLGNGGDPYVDRVRLLNTDSVRPKFGLVLERVELNMDFGMRDRAVLPLRLELKFMGRAWFFIRVDENLHYSFHGFRPGVTGTPQDVDTDSGQEHGH